jgi:hypothetical protein
VGERLLALTVVASSPASTAFGALAVVLAWAAVSAL